MRSSRPDVLCVLCAVVGLLCIALWRSELTKTRVQMAAGPDVYALVPPEQVVVGSLGYRAALADLLFAQVIVSAGTHLQERRLFEFAGQYIDTINALDPKFRDPYRFADSIMTLQTVEVPRQTYEHARRILERGTRELPYDQELWLSAGQFLAFLAPAVLATDAERSAWRQQGARYLARACELIGSNEAIPYQCYSAATLFSAAGNLAAAQSFLERLLVTTDNPEIRGLAEAKLRQLIGEGQERLVQSRARRFEQLWRTDMPFVSRTAMSALGPRFEPFLCAGGRVGGKAQAPICANSFRDKLAVATTDLQSRH